MYNIYPREKGNKRFPDGYSDLVPHISFWMDKQETKRMVACCFILLCDICDRSLDLHRTRLCCLQFWIECSINIQVIIVIKSNVVIEFVLVSTNDKAKFFTCHVIKQYSRFHNKNYYVVRNARCACSRYPLKLSLFCI